MGVMHGVYLTIPFIIWHAVMEESGNDYVDLSDAIIKLNDIQDASAPSECLMFDRVYVCIICIFCPW